MVENENVDTINNIIPNEGFFTTTLYHVGATLTSLEVLELPAVKYKVKELETIVQMGEYKKNNNLEDTDKCIVCCKNDMSTCYDCCSEIGDRCPLCWEESGYKRVYIPWGFL